MENSTELPREKVADIRRCSRCKGDHDGVVFTRFSEAPVIDDDGKVWDYWGFCPTSNEPVLLRVFDVALDGDDLREGVRE